jgi:hypothetical protein
MNSTFSIVYAEIVFAGGMSGKFSLNERSIEECDRQTASVRIYLSRPFGNVTGIDIFKIENRGARWHK